MGNHLTPALIHKYRIELMQFAVSKVVAGESVLYLSLELDLDTLKKRFDSELAGIKPRHSWKSLKGCMSSAFLEPNERDISKAYTTVARDFLNPTVMCVDYLELASGKFDIDQFAKANGIQVATFTADGCVVTVPSVAAPQVPLRGVFLLPDPVVTA